MTGNAVDFPRYAWRVSCGFMEGHSKRFQRGKERPFINIKEAMFTRNMASFVTELIS